MSKLNELQKDIEALKKAINNPNNTNPQAKASMEAVLAKLEAQAKSLASSSPAGKTYKDELVRQRATGEARGEAISLSAMSKAINSTKSTVKKSVPQPKSKEEKYAEDEDDYCAKVIAQAKERRRKAKQKAKEPQKSPATKNKEKLEKVFDNVKERSENESITKAELVKLIRETEVLLGMLKKKLEQI